MILRLTPHRQWATSAAAMLACALCLSAPSALALKDDDKQPMLIEADKVELDEAKSTSIYIGNVQVDQGSMRLLADLVTVHHKPDRRIQTIVAEGAPAKYKQLLDGDQGEMQAFAKRMDFDADKNELTLIGEALLIQGKDRIASDRIVYDRARSRMQAGGTGRVKITLTPETKDNAKPKGATQAPASARGQGRP
jgi:lipopolysaccharide export system protein LptA